MQPISAAEAARHIIAANAHGEEIVSVLAVEGPHAGARLLVTRAGRVHGQLPPGCAQDSALYLAEHVFKTREATLANGFFAELHAPAETLLIFGAGHIAVPLAQLGVQLGFSVLVLDDREEFARDARFPAAARVARLDYTEPLRDVHIDAATHVVLVTRAHKYDFDCLKAILALEAQPRYIGMIGSRRRVRAAFTALLEGGVSRELLSSVRAPVGLDIGAETPAEIAVSIAAELIAVRRGVAITGMTSEERVLERFFAEQQVPHE